MMRAAPPATLLLLVATAAIGAARLAGAQDATPEKQASEPKKIGLAERAGRRLAQLDMTVIGPPDVVARLTAADFRIKINLRKLKSFELDRLCPAATGSDSAADSTVQADSPASSASYLFYFDQPFLTLSGRQRAIDVARTLVDRLIRGNARGMIVSNAAKTVIEQPLTSDRALLHRALDALSVDRTQWDLYAELEDDRLREVVTMLNWTATGSTGDISSAIARARVYQKQERWIMDRNMRRLAVTLGQLVDLDAPKALIYFGDMLRSNAGEHYLSFFGSAMQRSEPALEAMTSDALAASLAFDKVVNEASAQGIRVYPVEARGLVTQLEPAVPAPYVLRRTLAVPSSSRVRIGDTHRTLESLAAETGGQPFLNGIRASKIADRILSDAECVYLASFDPDGFPLDQPLQVIAKVDREDVKLRVRGRLVLQSEAARTTSQILRAFSSPDSIPDPFEVRVGVVPTDFEKGVYTAMLQISVPGSPLHGATWDLGGTLYSDQKVRDKASGRLSASGPDVPVIFEYQLRFKAGAYELVGVAHEETSGLVASTKIDFDWPQLKGAEPRVGPIVVLQPAAGAFFREGQTRLSGSLLVSEQDPVLTSRPVAFVALVCRGKHPGPLRVERRLVGDMVLEFPSQELDVDAAGCAQVRDVVPGDSIAAGYYRYEIRIENESKTFGEGRRELVALAVE